MKMHQHGAIIHHIGVIIEKGDTMSIRKSISFTDPHDAWIKAQITSGKYTSDSEVVRDLIRRQQEREDQFSTLKAAIQEGLESGISDKTVPQIMKNVEERLRADGKL